MVKVVPGLGAALGNRLRQAREAAGLTPEGAAAALGTEPSLVSRLESGVKLPSVDLLLLLGALYGISAGTLMAETERALGLSVGCRDDASDPIRQAKGKGSL